jgi:pimeloyl-ACP methyl ester carboxylesterase
LTAPRDTEPTHEVVSIHGHEVSYRIAGEGPVILLIHGITGTSDQWEPAMQLLAEHYTVVAPDLLGHGRSAKPRGDYSLGAYASGLRDLMVGLGLPRFTVVGHSLGGGIAMQLAYQFPERCERLVLVSSGGLGREVHVLLRAATLPGSELVLPLISNDRIRAAGMAVAAALDRIGLRAGPDLAEMARGFGSIADGDSRAAFLHSLRAVIDPGGQRVSATDRLYLAESMPALVVWGRRDPLIPVHHAGIAHRGMPGSHLEVFDEAGHFPMLAEPVRFARVLRRFIESTEAADLTVDDLRERVLAGAPSPSLAS